MKYGTLFSVYCRGQVCNELCYNVGLVSWPLLNSQYTVEVRYANLPQFGCRLDVAMNTFVSLQDLVHIMLWAS